MRNAATISTVLVPAASYNLTDIATVKALLGITTTTSDADLNLWIAQASGAAIHFCNQPFVVETIQDQIWPTRDGLPWTVKADVNALQLSRAPIVSAGSAAPTNPPLAPTLSTLSGGSLAAAVYAVGLTYVTPYGETPIGALAYVACAAGQLFSLAPPADDEQSLALAYNVYACAVGATPSKQASAVGLGAAWTLPASGLVAGAVAPSVIQASEQRNGVWTPLGFGVDFTMDATNGTLLRLDQLGNPKGWGSAPKSVIYQAGFTTIPSEVVWAVVELVKMRYYAQLRDPMIRQENIQGVQETTYWFGSGPNADGDMPPHVTAELEGHRRRPIT